MCSVREAGVRLRVVPRQVRAQDGPAHPHSEAAHVRPAAQVQALRQILPGPVLVQDTQQGTVVCRNSFLYFCCQYVPISHS